MPSASFVNGHEKNNTTLKRWIQFVLLFFAIKLNGNLQFRKNGEANHQTFLATASKEWKANPGFLFTDKKQLITTTCDVSFSIRLIKPTYEPTPTCNMDDGWIEIDSERKQTKSQTEPTAWLFCYSVSMNEVKNLSGDRQLKQKGYLCSICKKWATVDRVFDPGGNPSILTHSHLAKQAAVMSIYRFVTELEKKWGKWEHVSANSLMELADCIFWQFRIRCCRFTIFALNDTKKAIFQRFF